MSASSKNKAPNTITMNGREFTLKEPDFGIVLRLLNIIGRVGVRGAGEVQAALANLNSTTLVFGMLAAMRPEDVLRLGAAVLQFADEAEGVAWLEETGVKITPLVQAFVLNLSLSEDLVNALENFTTSILAGGNGTPSPVPAT